MCMCKVVSIWQVFDKLNIVSSDTSLFGWLTHIEMDSEKVA